MISVVIKFSVISRKRHYRKSMGNASRRIRTHLLETDNATFIRVNIKSPASFPEVLFPARKQSRRAVVVVTSFLQFPATCIDTAGPLFRFPSRNRGESCVTGLYTRSICARSLRARNGSRQNQGLTRVHIPLYNGKTSDGLLHVTWENRIYYLPRNLLLKACINMYEILPAGRVDYRGMSKGIATIFIFIKETLANIIRIVEKTINSLKKGFKTQIWRLPIEKTKAS